MRKSIKSKFKKFKLFYDVYHICLYLSLFLKKGLLLFPTKDGKLNNDIPPYKQAMKTLNSFRTIPDCNETIKPLPLAEVDLSIIIPIYNAQKYLEKCLDSLREQITHYSYEVICVDDGSIDSSGRILDSYRDDDRFVIIHQMNKGHSGARNTGLNIAKGQYITFVDSDDYISIDFVENCLNAFEKNQTDIVQCSYSKCNEESKELRHYKYPIGSYNSFMEYIQFDGTPWGKVYSRNLWELVRFPDDMTFEDTIILNVVFRRCKKVTVINNATYFYRIYGENTIDKVRRTPKVVDVIYSIKYCLDLSIKLQLRYTVDYYAFLLLQCSTHVWYRIKELDNNIQKSAFSILCTWVSEYRDHLEENVIFDDIVIRKLDICFKKKDYKLWKKCSDIYPSNHILVRQGYKVYKKSKQIYEDKS